MPQLKPYYQQVSSGGVPDVATPSAAGMAQEHVALEGVGNAGMQFAQSLYHRKVQDDLSDINVGLSKTQNEWTQKYQDALQKGTLNTEEFNKDLTADLDSKAEAVQTADGKFHFRQAAAQLKMQFLDKTIAGSAHLAGVKAVSNFKATISNDASTLMNDPSQFEDIASRNSNGLDAMVRTGGLPAEAAPELKRHAESELAKAAVMGWIKGDAQNAKEQLQSGKWDKYFDSAETKQHLFNQVKIQESANRQDEERQQKLKQKEADAVQEAVAQDFLVKLNDPKGDGLAPKDVVDEMRKGTIDSKAAEHWLKMIDVVSKEKIKTDYQVYQSVWDRIHLEDGDPKKLVNEREVEVLMGRGLTQQDVMTLRTEMQGKKTQAGHDEAELKKAFLDNIKGNLTKSNPLIGIRDVEGDANYLRYMNYFLPEYSRLRKEGKSPAELMDPDNPLYLGKQANQYHKTAQQVFSAAAKDMKANAPTQSLPPEKMRKQGESINDYRKRMGQ